MKSKQVMIEVMNKQKVIIVVLIFLLLTSLLFFLKTPFLKPPYQQVSKLSPTPTAISTKPIIKEALDYIESQYLNGGFYNYMAHYEDYCEIKEGEMVCPYGGKWTFPETNAWTSLAYLAGYQTLGDQKYLDLAKKDVDRLILHCEGKPQDCLWSLAQVAKLYQVTNDSHYLDFLKKEGEILLKTPESTPVLADIEAKQLAILFQLTKDELFLKEARQRLTIDTGQNEIKPEAGIQPSVCWATLAYLELYRATDETQYLEKAKEFLAPTRVSDYQNAYSLGQSQPCLESLLELGQITGDQKFLTQASGWSKKIISQNWDSQKAKKIYGEGGFLTQAEPGQKPYILLTDTSYMVYLLARLEKY